MKRHILLSLLLLVCLFVVGCTNNSTTKEKDTTTKNDNTSTNTEEEPKQELLDESYNLDYESEKEFVVYPYGGVPGKLNIYDKNGNVVESNVPISDEKLLEYYTQIKEAGFTVTTGGYINMTIDDYRRALPVCEQLGLKMMIYDGTLVNLLMDQKRTDGVVVDDILNRYEDIFNSPAFYGIEVDDEPTPAELSGFKTALRRWQFLCPDKMFYINLFPSIAFSSSSDGNFETYIQKFCEEVDVDYVCYDHYPLQYGREGNYLRDDFLYNLVTCQLNSRDRRHFTVLQSIKYGGLHRELQSSRDVTFQAYSAIACGYEGFGWFCFWPPVPFDGATHFGDGSYDRITNEPTDSYYYIKDGLNEIRKLEDVFFNFTWEGINTVIGEKNDFGGENTDFMYSTKAVVESERIESIKTEQDTLVGIFKDAQGNDGFMVVNFTEPSLDNTNKVTIKFKDCTKVAVWVDGEQKVYSVTDGTFVFTQSSGDGYFIVPIK